MIEDESPESHVLERVNYIWTLNTILFVLSFEDVLKHTWNLIFKLKRNYRVLRVNLICCIFTNTKNFSKYRHLEILNLLNKQWQQNVISVSMDFILKCCFLQTQYYSTIYFYILPGDLLHLHVPFFCLISSWVQFIVISGDISVNVVIVCCVIWCFVAIWTQLFVGCWS